MNIPCESRGSFARLLGGDERKRGAFSQVISCTYTALNEPANWIGKLEGTLPILGFFFFVIEALVESVLPPRFGCVPHSFLVLSGSNDAPGIISRPEQCDTLPAFPAAVNHHLWENVEDAGVHFNTCDDVYAPPALTDSTAWSISWSMAFSGCLWAAAMKLLCTVCRRWACTGNKQDSPLIHLYW